MSLKPIKFSLEYDNATFSDLPIPDFEKIAIQELVKKIPKRMSPDDWNKCSIFINENKIGITTPFIKS